MKEYIQPEVEIISFMTLESITSEDDPEGSLTLSTNIFNQN